MIRIYLHSDRQAFGTVDGGGGGGVGGVVVLVEVCLHQDVGFGVHVVGVGGGVVTTGDGHRYAFHLFSNGRRFPFETGQKTSNNTATG